jgi:hypothetical protein
MQSLLLYVKVWEKKHFTLTFLQRRIQKCSFHSNVLNQQIFSQHYPYNEYESKLYQKLNLMIFAKTRNITIVKGFSFRPALLRPRYKIPQNHWRINLVLFMFGEAKYQPIAIYMQKGRW